MLHPQEVFMMGITGIISASPIQKIEILTRAIVDLNFAIPMLPD